MRYETTRTLQQTMARQAPLLLPDQTYQNTTLKINNYKTSKVAIKE
jgi:hypothetical protein